MTGPRGGAALLVGAAVLWGTAGTVAALGAPGEDPASIAAVRLVGGGLVLAAAAGPATLSVGRAVVRGVAGCRVLWWAAAAITAVVGYQVFFFEAVASVGVARGTLVALGSAPLITGVLSWVVTQRAPGWRWAGATAVAGAGLVLLVGVGGGGILSAWSAVAAGACYAVYAVGSATLIRAGLPSAGVMGLLFGGGAVILLPVLVAVPPTWVVSVPGAVAAGYLATATLAAAYLLFGLALRRIAAAQAATLSLAEPATAALLGVVVLGESLPTVGWLGIALLGIGLVAASWGGRPRVRHLVTPAADELPR
ncbi:MAG: DMT family transporter [Kineosporiaceae bacterium]